MLPYYYFSTNPWYLLSILIMIPSVIIAGWAQMKVYSNYSKYSKVQNAARMTGEAAARQILNANGLSHIAIQHVPGELSDHYDPGSKVIRLSDAVYDSTSLAAVAVAAHECGHAIQDAQEYQPMRWRSRIAPVASFATQASWIIIFAGLLLSLTDFAILGAFLFGAVVLFHLVTLPVELNASARALNILQSEQMLVGDEIVGAKKVLSAAAMTYVAAVITAVLELIRLIIMALMFRRNRW